MAKAKKASKTEAAVNSSAATAAEPDIMSGSLNQATPSQAIPASAIPVTAPAAAGEASQPPAQQQGTAAPNNESTNVDSPIHWLESVNTAAINLLAKAEKLKRTLAECAPLLEAVQEGFQKLRDKANLVGIPEDRHHILGCKTFQEFIDKKLEVTKQAVYKALETWEIKKEYGIPADQPLPSSHRRTGEPSPVAEHDGSAKRATNAGTDTSSDGTETDAGIETATSAGKHPKKSAAALMHYEDAKTEGGYYRKDLTSWFHKALRRDDEKSALFSASLDYSLILLAKEVRML